MRMTSRIDNGRRLRRRPHQGVDFVRLLTEELLVSHRQGTRPSRAAGTAVSIKSSSTCRPCCPTHAHDPARLSTKAYEYAFEQAPLSG